MDKAKVKAEIQEVATLTAELVEEGKLDGDQAKQLLFEFSASTIRKEFVGNAEVS